MAQVPRGTVSNYGDASAPYGVVSTERTNVGFAQQPTLDGCESIIRIFAIPDLPRPSRVDMANAIAALVADGLATKEEIRRDR